MGEGNMFEDPVPPLVRQAMIDGFTAGDIADLLELTPEQMLEAFAEEIVEALPLIREELSIMSNEDDAIEENNDG